MTAAPPRSFDKGTDPGSAATFDAAFAEIAAASAGRDLERRHPHLEVALLKSLGFGALRLPRAEGGGGASLRQTLKATLRLAEADPNVAHVFRNHFTFVERFLIDPTEARSRAWREAVRDGALVGLASTELDRERTGGPGGFKTALTPEGDGYRLTGVKYYSTGTLYADLLLVRATTPEGRNASAVLPVDRAGIARIDDWDGIGQRVTGSGTTTFEAVRVEADEVIFDDSAPAFLLPYASTLAQVVVTAIEAGILRAALRDGRALLTGRARTYYFAPAERTVDDPLLLQTLGRIAADAFAAELAVLAAAEALDRVAEARLRGDADLEDLSHEAALVAAKAKVIVDEVALRSTNALFDLGGASAARRDRNLDRHWRNARTLASHNPAAYKAQALGAWEANGTPLPKLGFF